MGLRFSRRVTLFPGVRLNFSRRGISASFGPRGASVTVGPRGSALNLGIPGTGLSFRQQLTTTNGHSGLPELPAPQAPVAPRAYMDEPAAPSGTEIQSAPVAEVTSEGLDGLKDLIKKVLAEREALRRSIPAARAELERARRRLRRAESWFLGMFLKKKVPERKAAVEAKDAELMHQEERLSGAFIDAEFGLDDATRGAFGKLTEAFEAAAGCARIWDITSARANDRKVTRSSAVRTLERTVVRFSISEDPVFQQSDAKVLRLQNANGADLLVYPGFVLLQNRDDLALIQLREISVTYSSSRFIEEETVPPDAVVVDYTWAKCNKDGSPDRRFANNHQIPVAGYGAVMLESPSGLCEQYQFSSAEKAERFAECLTDYQAKLRVLGDRVPGEPTVTATTAGTIPGASGPADRALRSVAFLQAASAVSGNHAIKILEQFTELLTSDVKAFSGNRPLEEVEAFVNELARVPEAVRSFFGRTPAAAPGKTAFLNATRNMVRVVLAQMRGSLEQVEPKPDDVKRVLELVREAEAVLM